MTRLVTVLLVAACVCAQAADLAALGAPTFVWEGARIWRDLKYGPRPDAPGEGEAYRSPMTHRDEHGHIVHSHRTGQFYDLLVPERGTGSDSPVYLNLHGGAWSAPCDKDGENLWFFVHLVRRGFVVVNINYMLQPDILGGEGNVPVRPDATFVDMLRDIDAAVTHLKEDLLPKLGVRTDRIALGGGSAGAHLSLLYGLDQDNPSVLSAGLRHDLRVGFIVDFVGPTDFTNADFLKPLTTNRMPWGSLFNKDAIAKFGVLLDGLAGRDIRTLWAQGRHEEACAELRRFSPLYLLTPRSAPMILAHNRLWPFSSTDGCVPVSMYRDMLARLDELAVHHEAQLRTWAMHGWMKPDQEQWLVERCARFAARYLKTGDRK